MNLSPNISRESISSIEIQHALSRISVGVCEECVKQAPEPEHMATQGAEPLKEEESLEKVNESAEKKADEGNEKVVESGDKPVESTEKTSEKEQNVSEDGEHQKEPQKETKPSQTTPSEKAVHSETPTANEEAESNSYCCCVYSPVC